MTGFNRDTLLEYFESNPATGCVFMRNLAGVIGRRLQAMPALARGLLCFALG